MLVPPSESLSLLSCDLSASGEASEFAGESPELVRDSLEMLRWRAIEGWTPGGSLCAAAAAGLPFCWFDGVLGLEFAFEARRCSLAMAFVLEGLDRGAPEDGVTLLRPFDEDASSGGAA